ncbi:hypothetical protein GCM10009621_11630 [Corynebacterium felinum]
MCTTVQFFWGGDVSKTVNSPYMGVILGVRHATDWGSFCATALVSYVPQRKYRLLSLSIRNYG